MDHHFLTDNPLDPLPSVLPVPITRYEMQFGYPEPGASDNSNGNGANADEKQGLITPIPPLHIQQQLVNSDLKPVIPSPQQQQQPQPHPQQQHQRQPHNILRSSCSRCKKDFDQHIIIPQSNELSKPIVEPKIFKLCQHCRDLQRQRSRRWQKKTKDKHGACRRCGSEIPPDQQKFVLCPSCRQNLRTRKANRAAQGKCVHCSGPLDSLIITNNKTSPKTSGQFKVCQRCRENDKIRRTNLEKMGNCNRCAKTLDIADQGKHKVCLSCRNRKKRLNQNQIHIHNNHWPQVQPQVQPPAQVQVQVQPQNQLGQQYNNGFMYNSQFLQPHLNPLVHDGRFDPSTSQGLMQPNLIPTPLVNHEFPMIQQNLHQQFYNNPPQQQYYNQTRYPQQQYGGKSAITDFSNLMAVSQHPSIAPGTSGNV